MNYELPNVAADYVHRIGRTGRAGAVGEAISLVCGEEADDLQGIEDLIGKNIERRELPGFIPQMKVPESRPPKAPKKPKKPKKPKEFNRDGGENSAARKPTARRNDAAKPAASAAAKTKKRIWG